MAFNVDLKEKPLELPLEERVPEKAIKLMEVSPTFS